MKGSAMSLIKETLVPGILVVFGVIYYFSVQGLPKHSTVFPFFLMIVMPLLIVMILVQEYRERPAAGSDADDAENAVKKTLADFKAPAVVFAASIGYVLLFSLAGFFVASFSYILFIMVYSGITLVRSAITSAVFTAALYVVFAKMFLVDL
jgi:hypothetical protein